MHDIDKTMMEFEGEGVESQEGLEPESGFEFEGEEGALGEYELIPQAEAPEPETPDQGEVLSNSEEMELASDLVSVSSEGELDQFLGKILKKAGGLLKSGVGSSLGGILKGVAKAALPWAGRAVGGMFGGPLGATIGGKLAPMAGRIFGLELEGLSLEDQEFETARRMVRLAADAVANAARASRTSASPAQIARAAVIKSALKNAPGLLRRRYAPSGQVCRGQVYGTRRSGRWFRRGNKIVLVGA